MVITYRLRVKDCIDALGENIDELSRIFYRDLLTNTPQLEPIFSGNTVILNRKFSNMLGTLRDTKHLEKIEASLAQMGSRHLQHHGAMIEHFPMMKTALIASLRIHLSSNFSPELETDWSRVFDEVSAIMKKSMHASERRQSTRKPTENDAYDPNLLEEMDRESIVVNVHQRFYDRIFEHPWLGQFFKG